MSRIERQQAKKERRLAQRQAPSSELVSGMLESEHLPDPLLIHQGMRHEELNLEGVATIGASLQRNLSRAKGKRIVLLENAGGTPDEERDLIRQIDQIGFQGVAILGVLVAEKQRPVSPREIRERVKQIAYTPKVSDVVRQRLLPLSDLQGFHLARELDKARSKWPFEVSYERHNALVNQEDVTGSAQGTALSQQARDFWENRQFIDALDSYTQSQKITTYAAGLRDPEIVQLGISHMERLKHDKNGGMLFMLFGDSHSANGEEIAALALGDRSKGEVMTSQSSTLHGEIEATIRNGQEVPAVLYARELFITRAMEATIQKHLQGEGDFDYFVQRYESHRRAIEQYANSLSLEQVRASCESGQQFAFIQNS